MRPRYDVAVVGSGFAGSLMARILAAQGHTVALIERGTHPRFAIGESSTPLANLSLERIAVRYGLADCYRMATHGRWLEHFPGIRRGLKRGFTFYRHHPGRSFAARGLESERLLVAASPHDAVADTHWLRADVDQHWMQRAVAEGVVYFDQVQLTSMEPTADAMRLTGHRSGTPFALDAGFVIDATGQAGFIARQLGIPSGLEQTETRSALLYAHFDGVRPLRDVVPGLPEGPYADEWAAVHHLIDEGWMYSLRFDHGVTSAGFALTPRGLATFGATDATAATAAAASSPTTADRLWRALMERYPTLGAAFADATPITPLVFQPAMQHRLTRAVGERWALLPHAYAFVDPLFSTGIAWSLRAIERLALCFAPTRGTRALPSAADLARYDALLVREADQIDRLIAGAYEAMPDFDLFAAHSMLYFAAVSFAEARERLVPDEAAAWNGFLGVDDPVLAPLPLESLRRLRALAGASDVSAAAGARRDHVRWIAEAIAPRNVAGLADPRRHDLYPADLDVLIERHALLGLTRDQVVAALPALRGMAPEPAFG